MAAPPLQRREPLPHRVDLRSTLGPLRRGVRDRCVVFADDGVWRATRTPAGPATVRLRVEPRHSRLDARAWGPGAEWALEHVRQLVGADDDDSELAATLAAPGGGPGRDLLRSLHRRLQGLRIPATGAVTEALVPTVLEQKVTGLQARRSYQTLVSRLGAPAPGPAGGPRGEGRAGGGHRSIGLLLPPAPETLAATPSWEYHRAGVEGKRARTISHACGFAHRLDPPAFEQPREVQRRLGALPGIGAWSVAEVSRVALGDADAVSVGDYHLHNQVAWALAGLARADDDVMLELLEPYRGQRGRVTRLIEAGGITAPRFGPRLTIQSIDAI